MIKRDFFGYSLLQNTVLVYKENMTMIGQHLGDFFSQTHLVTLALILEWGWANYVPIHSLGVGLIKSHT
jgi:hypothetical protein